MLLEKRSPTVVGMISLVLLLLLTTNAISQEECAGLTYEGMCTGNLVQWCEEGEVIQVDCTDHGMICAWDDGKGYSCVAGNTMNTCDLPPEGLCISDTTLHWCEEEGVETLECANGMFCGWNNELMYYDCIPEDSYSDYAEQEPAERTEESPTDDTSSREQSENEDTDWEEESFIDEGSEGDVPRDEEKLDRENSPVTTPEESPEKISERASKYEDEAKVPNSPRRLAGEQSRSPKEDMGLILEPSESPQPSGCQHGSNSHGFQLLLLGFALIFLARKQQGLLDHR